MKLYDLELSGNSYRVRLLLSLLGLKHEVATVNLMKGENREPWFLKLNPRRNPNHFIPRTSFDARTSRASITFQGFRTLTNFQAVRSRD